MYISEYLVVILTISTASSSGSLYKDISCSQVNLQLLKQLRCNLAPETLLNPMNCYMYWSSDIFSTLTDRCLAFAYDAVSYQCASCCGEGEITMDSLTSWSSLYVLGTYLLIYRLKLFIMRTSNRFCNQDKYAVTKGTFQGVMRHKTFFLNINCTNLLN